MHFLDKPFSTIKYVFAEERIFCTLFGDIRESASEELTLSAIKLFPEELLLKSIPLSASDCHAFGLMLRKVKKPLELNFSHCNLDDHSFFYISSAIKEMPGSVSLIHTFNQFKFCVTTSNMFFNCEIAEKCAVQYFDVAQSFLKTYFAKMCLKFFSNRSDFFCNRRHSLSF